MRASVIVTLKAGVLDPQGKAIEGALQALGIEGVRSVRQGKVFDVDIDSADPDEVEAVVRAACERLLANTVVEDFRIGVKRRPPPPAAPASQTTSPEAAE